MAQTWHKPKWPTIGEQLALHVVVGKGPNVPISELYVGREPWGKGGRLNGKNILDGRMIARAPLGTPAFDEFMLLVARKIAHMNPDTETGTQTVELAMSLQARGVGEPSAMKMCAHCELSRNTDAFTRKSEFSWSVNLDHHPRLIGDSPCVFCHRTWLQAFETILKNAENVASKHDGSCDDVLMRERGATLDNATIVALMGTKRLATQLTKLRRHIQDIELGKI